MEKKQYRRWCSMTPLVCSIVPFGVAALTGIYVFAFPAESNCFGLPNSLDDAVKLLIPCCAAPLIALLMVPMGICSILLGIAEIRVRELRGRLLMVVAILLGVLDIEAGIVYLFWIFSNVLNK